MICFKNPTLETMACGFQCIELTDSGSWQTFDAFANAFTGDLNGTIIRKVDGIDIRVWLFEYEGAHLNLVYRDYPNGISIEPQDEAGDNAVKKLFKTLMKERSPQGI